MSTRGDEAGAAPPKHVDSTGARVPFGDEDDLGDGLGWLVPNDRFPERGLIRNRVASGGLRVIQSFSKQASSFGHSQQVIGTCSASVVSR